MTELGAEAGGANGDLETRVSALEAELQAVKEALVALPGAIEKEKASAAIEQQQQMTQLQEQVVQAAAASKDSVKAVTDLNKRVEVVKKESTSGVVASVVVFSILVMVSMFIRSG